MNFQQSKWLLTMLVLPWLISGTASAETTVTYYHTDALGSPVATTDANGNVIERSEYEPYGKLLNRPLEDEPGYTGHVSDAATGLSYMQQRYYDPWIGRFLSVDPVTADTVTGWNFNRYNYAANNPYKFTDPDGRCIWDGCVAEIVVGGIIVGAAIDYIGQKVRNPDQPVNKTSVAISGAVGGATAVIPGALAVKAAWMPAKVAVAGTSAAAIGSAGSAARQEISTGQVDGGQVAKEGLANAVGYGVGSTLGATVGRTIATSTVPAVRGTTVTSLSGRTFNVGAQPAVRVTDPVLQQGAEATLEAAGSATTTKTIDRLREK